MKFKYTCKEASALIVDREDRKLDWPERLLLALHLQVCDACTRFEGQIAFMRRAMRAWRARDS